MATGFSHNSETLVATIQDRSPSCVAVKNRDDLTGFFPFNKFAAVEAYMAQLRAP